MDGPDAAARPRAIRLIFEYDSESVRLAQQVPVDMYVANDEDPGPDGSYYVELRDQDGVGLRQVNVPGQGLAGLREVFGPPGTPITRVVMAEPRGAFTVVVPATESATTVALLRQEATVRDEVTDAEAAVPPSRRLGVELIAVPLTVPDGS